MSCAATLLPTALLLLSGAARADNPNPVELARKSIQAGNTNDAKAQQYAFREYKVTRELDDNGKETGRRTETWEIIGLEGSTYRKLVMRNDMPLVPKEQKREDERLKKETDRRRKETPEQRHNRVLSFTYTLSFPYEKLADIYDLRYLGDEVVGARHTWVIEGTPKPDYRPANGNEKEILNYTIKLWLAQGDCYLARMDMDVIGEHSRMQKGSHIREESDQHDDGVWLPSTLTFDYNARFFKVLNVRGEMTLTYSDYHKFQVDSRVVDTDTPH
jgi:hypothetical protein